jgi:hypothetical protein
VARSEEIQSGLFFWSIERSDMQVLRTAEAVAEFVSERGDESLQRLVAQRVSEMTADEYSMEELVFFVILDASDSLSDLKFALMGDGQANQDIPPWEVIEEQDTCFELVFVLESSGYGALVFAPKSVAHPEVLSLCQTHAIPKQEWPT